MKKTDIIVDKHRLELFELFSCVLFLIMLKVCRGLN